MQVDAGKSLFSGYVRKDEKTAEIAAKGIAEAYIEMGYDAVAAGTIELSAGQNFLDSLAAKDFPWISANLFDSENELLFPPYRLKNLGDITIGIMGLSDEHRVPPGYIVKSYKDILPAQLETLRSKCDLILLLSNYPQQINRDIAHQFPEIDIIISSDRNAGKMMPHIVRNTLMTQVSSRGKYLGRIDICWEGKGVWLNQQSIPLDALKKRQQKIEKQLQDLAAEDPQETKNRRKIGRLKLQKKRISQEIAERIALEEKSADQDQNSYKVSFLPVKPTSKPKEIESIVLKIKAELQAIRKTP